MKIKRYYVEVFVEPEAYEMVRLLRRGDGLSLRMEDSRVKVFLDGKEIGVVRGKKRVLVSALFEFEREVDALFYNMNEKEGVMLVRVKTNDEPYK